uniref:Uncharacterized protein n=1 Tax=Corethron hystrix TaxID=216773 RepID=A0A7S1BA54_9STRA|mmetsp:Transcript_17826/g.40500  ORF Transcript_17826/g.40500 Transcript_17826/m.40500 type:complete len:185 (+) Transcript_17826:239-793(+)
MKLIKVSSFVLCLPSIYVAAYASTSNDGKSATSLQKGYDDMNRRQVRSLSSQTLKKLSHPEKIRAIETKINKLGDKNDVDDRLSNENHVKDKHAEFLETLERQTEQFDKFRTRFQKISERRTGLLNNLVHAGNVKFDLEEQGLVPNSEDNDAFLQSAESYSASRDSLDEWLSDFSAYSESILEN